RAERPGRPCDGRAALPGADPAALSLSAAAAAPHVGSELALRAVRRAADRRLGGGRRCGWNGVADSGDVAAGRERVAAGVGPGSAAGPASRGAGSRHGARLNSRDDGGGVRYLAFLAAGSDRVWLWARL